MAKVWKKLQRADSAFEGNVTGTIDGTAAGTVKSGASAGTSAKTITDAAFDSNTKLKTANAQDGMINSNTTKSDVGLANVANESPSTLKTTMALNNVENKSQATILSGNLTGTVDGTAVATVKSGAAKGETANQDSTATILGGNLTGTVDGTAVATVKSGAAKGATAPVTFRQDGIPTALNAGDLWIDTNDSNKQYRATATGDDEIKSGEWEAIHTGKIHTYTKGDVGLGSVDNQSAATIQAGTTKANVGLANVANESPSTLKTTMALNNVENKSQATILSGNLTGTVDGTAVATVKSGAAAGATANQDTTATILGGNLTGTVDGTAVATVKSGAALGASSNQDSTSDIRSGTTKAHVGLSSVVNQAITMDSGKLKFDGTAQTIDADKLGGDTKSTVEASAVSTAETNIIGGAPGALQTLDALAAALGDDASFSSTMTTNLATKGKAPMTLTAEDVDGDSTYDNDPASEAIGQIGVYGGHSYQVVDV
jgi:hypothetical protein